MITLKCICCGVEAAFHSDVEAYREGWDCQPYFSIGPLCDLCPAAPVALKGLTHAQERHAESHARWEKEGRPPHFETANECRLDGYTEEQVQVFMDLLHKAGAKE